MKNQEKKPNKKQSWFIYDFMKITGAPPGLIFFRLKRHFISEKAKKKIKGGAIVIANHTTLFDPVILMFVIWYRRHSFVCRREVLENKAGRILKWCHCIPIDKDNISIGSFREMTNRLKEGGIVSMFPEGQLNMDKESMTSFKSGMILMALQSKAPIVPIYIKKRKSIWNRLEVVIGEPVDIIELYGERPTFQQMEDAAKLLAQKEEELKKFLER